MLGSAMSTVSTLLLVILLHGKRVRAQTGDGPGGSAEGAGNSQIGSSSNDGNVGPESNSGTLSTGAIVAICVVAVFVIIGIVTLAALFYIAKKRQWEVRKTIRKTATRVVAAMTPRTPKVMSFSPNATRKPPKKMRFQDDEPSGRRARNGDLEKGSRGLAISIKEGDESRSSEESKSPGSNGQAEKRPRPKPANITVPSSEFEMDSPKTPVWQKVFGRR